MQTGNRGQQFCCGVSDPQRPEMTRDVIGKLALHFPEVRLDVSFTYETDDVFMEIIAVLGDLLPLRDFQNFRIIMQKAKTTGGAGIDDVISRIDIIGQRGGVLLSKEAGQGEVSIAERRQTAAPLRRQDNVDIK